MTDTKAELNTLFDMQQMYEDLCTAISKNDTDLMHQIFKYSSEKMEYKMVHNMIIKAQKLKIVNIICDYSFYVFTVNSVKELFKSLAENNKPIFKEVFSQWNNNFYLKKHSAIAFEIAIEIDLELSIHVAEYIAQYEKSNNFPHFNTLEKLFVKACRENNVQSVKILLGYVDEQCLKFSLDIIIKKGFTEIKKIIDDQIIKLNKPGFLNRFFSSFLG